VLCRGCGSEARLAWRASDENRRTSAEIFDYWRCSACKVIFLGEVPRDLGRYYVSGYHSFPPLRRLLRNAAREGYKVKRIRRFATRGRLLEIGPSYGSFALAAKHGGFDVEVMEQDEECRAYLRNVVQVKVLETDSTRDSKWPADRYDVVAMWQVLEHMIDPWLCLQRAAESLRGGGILVVATPNPESFQAGILGRRWPHVDAPRHITLFPASALSAAGSRAGLETVDLDFDDVGARGWNRFGWQRFVMNRLPTRLGEVVGRGLGFLMSIPLAALERGSAGSSAYTMVLRRQT
jgi:SAM-dependent methyltransferase